MTHLLFEKVDFLKYLFDSIPSGMYVVDRDLRIFHLNAAASRDMRVDRETALQRRSGEVMKCVHASETPGGCGRSVHCGECVIRNSVGKAFRGEKVYRETVTSELRSGDGVREVCFMVTASPLRYEGRDLVLLVMEDVTALKRAEEELRRHAARLEDANRELEAFGYTVSHDLKAPLRSIRGFSDALQEDHAAALDDEGKNYLERISSAGARMEQLIDDMLAFSRKTTDDVRRADIDLSALAESVAAECLRSAPGRVIKFVIKPGVVARCDERLIRIVLENLFSNAVKFTSAHERARIEFGSHMQGPVPVYSVRDDGAGFDMAQADKLFSPFKRLHNPSEFSGTGIGLATVRRIIHRHGGRVWAESAVEQGTAIYFTVENASEAKIP